MKLTILYLIGLITLLAACTSPSEPTQEPTIPSDGATVTFATFEAGFNAGTPNVQDPEQEAREVIVRDQETLNQEWDFMHESIMPQPDTPQVNFDEDMIIIAYMGVRGTGGYDITVVDVIEFDNRLEVMIEEVSPSPEDMVTQALTHPYHAIILERSDKEVVFVRE